MLIYFLIKPSVLAFQASVLIAETLLAPGGKARIGITEHLLFVLTAKFQSTQSGQSTIIVSQAYDTKLNTLVRQLGYAGCSVLLKETFS